MTDYRSILRDAGVNFAGLSFAEQNKLINALHAAHTEGYSAGYHAALSTPDSFVHGL
jgi:hypothetical protein